VLVLSILGTYIVVLITTPSRDISEKIAKEIVERRLGACVNIIPNVKSMYWWKQKIEKSDEEILIIKTRLDKFQDLVALVRELHTYTVPEIIALPIIMGNDDYLKWIDDNLK